METQPVPSWLLHPCVPAEGLGERVPPEVQGGGWCGAAAAGQDGGSAVAGQGDAARRLRTPRPLSGCSAITLSLLLPSVCDPRSACLF